MNKHRAQAPLRRFDEDRWWRYCLWATRAAGPTAVKLAQWASSREDRFPRCLLYTSPSPRDLSTSRMPSSA